MRFAWWQSSLYLSNISNTGGLPSVSPDQRIQDTNRHDGQQNASGNRRKKKSDKSFKDTLEISGEDQSVNSGVEPIHNDEHHLDIKI